MTMTSQARIKVDPSDIYAVEPLASSIMRHCRPPSYNCIQYLIEGVAVYTLPSSAGGIDHAEHVQWRHSPGHDDDALYNNCVIKPALLQCDMFNPPSSTHRKADLQLRIAKQGCEQCYRV